MKTFIPPNTISISKIIEDRAFTQGAEIGVKEGFFIEYLCGRFPSLNMVAVDLWGTDKLIDETHDHSHNYELAMARFKPFGDRVRVIRSLSHEAAAEVADKSLDFVFLDATHTFKALETDILAWAPKVKDDGIMSGHDYHPAWDGGGMINCVKKHFRTFSVDEFTCWSALKTDLV